MTEIKGGKPDEEDSKDQAQSAPPAIPPNGQPPGDPAQGQEQASGQDNGGKPQDEILKGKTNADSQVFAEFIGATIAGVSYKKNGANGGEISLRVSKSNMPLKISWAGDKVTVTKPNGNIVSI